MTSPSPPSADDASDWTAAPPAQACAGCGEPMDRHDRFCPRCGRPAPACPEASPEEAAAVRHLQCRSCGAGLDVDVGTRSLECPFCDTPVVVEMASGVGGRTNPEFVIPFALDVDEARRHFRQWLRDSSWYHPPDLAAAGFEEKLQAMYLPFWTFSFRARSQWSASIGEHWERQEHYTETDKEGRQQRRTRTIRETEWHPLAGSHHGDFVGWTISAGKGLPEAEANRIEPFRVEGMKPYDPAFLVGWASEEAALSRGEAARLAREQVEEEQRRRVAAFLPGDTHADLKVSTRLEAISEALVFAPVFLVAYRHGGTLYRYLLNGQTARQAGDKPVSWTRIAVAALVAMLAMVALLVLLTWGNAS